MVKIKIPEGLPDCRIIRSLAEKADKKRDYDFDYIGKLEEVRKIIAQEVSRINLLFPEYTPHDEQYHLKKLFYVADQMLGETLIESMNVTELFMLSVALYAHDWGMAVSDEDKKDILSDSELANPNLLNDERKRMREFCTLRNTTLKDIDVEDWREYVRQTHAQRSGMKIRHYFEDMNVGFGEYVAKICEGHWLDFDIIEDFNRFPTDLSTHREIVNIKALTIYVRLIDLLDLGEDRTPFVLWKFVAPRNKISKLEWDKHRALQPVSFPSYQSTSRIIQVDGSTNDHNVYLSIMDLKRYVDDQFRQCMNILNRTNHAYHKINISHIHWRVVAKEFEPVEIQFEFDRNKMFEILSDEIYRGNPYVFVRELLQNSIDAINVRIAILKKRHLSFTPRIDIKVTATDEHYIVQISDNGIGMDEYVIRNYLAVAGKSYYRSADFEKEGIKIDPISRFGIGILSCFMNAQYIEIETSKDALTYGKTDHFKISIPSRQNYFKIQKNVEVFETGTTFRVFVDKNELSNNTKSKKNIEFNVTEYLKRTAGFVKHPIHIYEDGAELFINHPKSQELYHPEFKIDFRFPIDKAFVSQDVNLANDYFVEKRFYLKSDLNLPEFDGCITYLLPKSDDIDIINDSKSWPTNKVLVVDYKKGILEYKKLKWKEQWVRYERNKKNNEGLEKESAYYAFIDGILIEDIDPPQISISLNLENEDDYEYRLEFFDHFVKPQFIVNIPKPKEMKIDLARTNIETIQKWDQIIWFALFNHIKETLIVEYIHLNGSERLLRLAKLMTFFSFNRQIIVDYLLPKDKFPLPLITKSGTLIFQDFDFCKHHSIRVAPSQFAKEFQILIEANYLSLRESSGILKTWNGLSSVINCMEHEEREKIPASLGNLGILTRYFINSTYYLSTIEFVSSPLGKAFPLVEEIYKIKPEEYGKLGIDELLISIKIEKNDDINVHNINRVIKSKLYHFPTIVNFSKPFADKALYGLSYFNFQHPKIKLIVNICLNIIKAEYQQSMPEKDIGILMDIIQDIEFIKRHYSYDDKVNLNNLNAQIKDFIDKAIELGVINIKDHSESEITTNDFIGNSIQYKKQSKSFICNFEVSKYYTGCDIWGESL